MSGAILGPKTADALLVSSDSKDKTELYQPGSHARKAEANASDVGLEAGGAASPARPSSSSSRSSLILVPSPAVGASVVVAGGAGGAGGEPEPKLVDLGRSQSDVLLRQRFDFVQLHVHGHALLQRS